MIKEEEQRRIYADAVISDLRQYQRLTAAGITAPSELQYRMSCGESFLHSIQKVLD